jgi:RsiW-degrading membrane proteinase PrsW (M82 family)/GNAT superfamily N-acetyltransferase
MFTLTVALAPTLAIALFILYRDKFDREPATVLLGSFFLGMLVTVPAMALEIGAGYFGWEETIHGTVLFVFFGVALVEEIMKFLPLRLYAFTRRSFDEPLDGIVHSVMVGLGFATLENLLYVYQNGLAVGVGRMFLSVPGHAAYGVFMGYFVGKAKFNYQRRITLLFTGLLTATLIHALYDSCLFVGEKIDDDSLKGLLIIGALATDVVAYTFAAQLIRQHRQISKSLYVDKPVCTTRWASPADVPLIRTLACQVWPLTYEKILSRAQIRYMMQLIYSEAALRKQMESGHQFILVFNAGIPVGFASFNEISPTIFKLQKIYLLQNQQGRGTGRFTIEQVISLVKEKDATALRLNVNRHNKAKLFYERMGFAVIAEEKIDIGGGYVMDDYVMEKKVTGFANASENLANTGSSLLQ